MKKLVIPAIAATLITFMAHAAPPAKAKHVVDNSTDKTKIQAIIKDYLTEHPEIIIQAVQNYQRKQYEQAEQTIKTTQKNASNFAAPLFKQINDPSTGNPNGKISVVEFFDYQCPHCIDMAPVIEALVKANPDVKVIFKEFPIRGPQSEFAARAALAANLQGKYYQFSHALLTVNKPLTEEIVYETAKSAGIDVDKLKQDMNSNAVKEQLKNNMLLAKQLNLFGTPAFFIGKTNATTKDNVNYVPGQMDLNQLQSAIDKANQ